MRKKCFRFGVVIGLLLLNGCTEYKIRQFETMTPKGPDFNKFLADKYGELAKKDSRERFEQDTGMVFILKAIDAANAKPVYPEKVEGYQYLTDDEKEYFSQERTRMLAAFEAGARDAEPEASAIVQTFFDYRIDKQNRGKEAEELDEHREIYNKAMAAVLAAVAPSQGPVPPNGQPPVPDNDDAPPVNGQPPMPDNAPPVNGQPPMPDNAPPPMNNQLLPSQIFDTASPFEHPLFPLDSAVLTKPAKDMLDKLVAEINRVENQIGRPVLLTVIGHTDATGTENRNIDLSLRRAYTVRGYLHKKGINSSRINIDGRGSSEPLVKRPKGVPEARNRRVDIFMHDQ